MNPADREMMLFFKFVGFKERDGVIDVGCGGGRLYGYFKEKYNYVGIDKKIDGDWMDIKFLDRADKVLFACVLHYNQKLKQIQMLRKANQNLGEKGRVCVIEPNKLNLFFYILYFWRWLIDSKCERRWGNEKYLSNRWELTERLRLSGFKNVEYRYYAWLPSKFGLWWLNDLLNRIPIIREFSAFIWVRGER